jgi:DNA-binding NarL/FixJ family response regulator
MSPELGHCQPIRILIADDHPFVRDGIVALIERQADMTIVAEAGDGAEAIALFREVQPDLVLMDIQMPRIGGLQAIEAIRREAPTARILVLTTYPGDAQVVRAIQAGAAGYLLKSVVRKELLDAIRSVVLGRPVLSPEVAHELAAHALDDHLTDREVEILRMVADGHANKEIAWRLDLSIDTIKAHLKKAFDKLGVDDRAHAVTVATRRGFIER